ncbi:MAG: hypothetical protein HN431_00005 [Bacteroidetes bacterium]|jgi:hypothetical protein|nr:hypothetical protein [Bacteroidota bacterium]
MKKIYTLLLFTFGFLLITFSGFSAHIFSGDLEWSHLNGDTFLIQLTVYKDCNGTPLNTAYIPVTCSTTGDTIAILNINKPAPIDVTPICDASCTRCQTSNCNFPYGIEKYVFLKQIVLNSSTAGSCCKISMNYGNCCRSTTITTGGANKYFFIEAEFNRCLVDDGPSFINPPNGIICIGQNFVFNAGAIDTDTNSSGQLLDSLSYEWASPLEFANQ